MPVTNPQAQANAARDPLDPGGIEMLFRAAYQHAADAGEPDHEVGDLQDLLRALWDGCTPRQRAAFLSGAAAAAVLEAGFGSTLDEIRHGAPYLGADPQGRHTGFVGE